jgi:hypothetical protein
MFIIRVLRSGRPTSGDMDASAQRAKIEDETGNHHTSDELGEPDMTSIAYQHEYMLPSTHTLLR